MTTYIKTRKGTPYEYTGGHVYKPGWLKSEGVGSARTTRDAIRLAEADSDSRVVSVRSVK